MRRIALMAAFLSALALPAPAADKLTMPLLTAKVGEWTVHRDVSGDKTGEMTRYKLVDRSGSGDDEAVTIRREVLGDDGKALEMRDIQINLARYKQRVQGLEEKAKQISFERMQVKDREVETVAVTWDQDSEDGQSREFKIWTSKDVPLGGMVRFWCSDPAFPATELVDYGWE